MLKADINKWGIAAATALYSIFLFYLNRLYPYFPGDDLLFQLIIPEEGIMGTERIQSLGDLIESQYNFYFNYHYRILNHFILQGLLALPPIIFDFLNVIVFLLLPLGVLKFSRLENDDQYWLKYFFLLMFIWVFHINLGWAYFPATGALNYTWYLIPQLWYLAILVQYSEGKEPNKGLFLGLAAVNALGNENACIMLCLLTGLVLLMTRKRPNWFLYLSFGFFVIGGIFMLVSPSIGKRLETQSHMSAGLVPHVVEFLKRTAYYCVRYLPVMLILLVGQTRLAIKTTKNLLLFIAFLAATFSMILAPLFEPRSAVLGFFVLLSLCFTLVDTTWKKWPVVLISIVGLILCITRLPAFQKQYERHQVNEQILEQNRNSTQRVALERYCDHSTRDYLLCHENSEDPNSFDNRTLSAYYNIKEVALSEKYVQRNRRQVLFDSLNNNSEILSTYNSQSYGDKMKLYYKLTKEGLDLVVETDSELESPYYILRGAARGINKYRLISLLPKSIRLYFLDYLESITLNQQKVLTKEETQYNYFFLSDYKRYDYVLLSLYSFETHSPVGEIYELSLE